MTAADVPARTGVTAALRRRRRAQARRIDGDLAPDPSAHALTGQAGPFCKRHLAVADFRGRAERVATIDDGAESIAFGPVGSLLEGALLIGHESNGRVTVLDPFSLRQTVIATAGVGRVEGIQPITEGRFLVTQGGQVDVFFAVAGLAAVASLFVVFA